MSKLAIGSLFSGCGGLDLGAERAGFGPIKWQVEIDEYASCVLAKHWPNAKRFLDVKTVGAKQLSKVDCIIGGFPCQDVSAAGKGAGIKKGKRSGLWREFHRILEELHPTYAIIENVASGAKRWLPHVRRDLHLLGYRTRALQLSAFDVGAPHLRERVFVLAADPKRVELRNESRWRGGTQRKGSTEPRDIGEARTSSDVDSESKLQQEGSKPSRWRWFADGDRWQAQSPVPGVVHGFSYRLHLGGRRQRLLGNAVVPDNAEIAARFLLDEAPRRP